MKILAIGRAFTGHCHGGMAVATHESCKALASQGHNVTLFTAGVPDKPIEFMHEGYMVSTSRMAQFTEYGRLYKDARDFYEATKPYDFVISHSKAGRDLVIKNRVDCPVIYVNHGNCVDYGWNYYNSVIAGCEEVNACCNEANEKHKRAFFTRDEDYGIPEKDVFNLFDAAICLTPMSRMDMQYRLQFANPVLMMPNPAPKNPGGDKDGPICVVSGTNQRIKGLFYIDQIKWPREVVVVGPVDSKRKGITCIGTVRYDRVQQVMAKCSMLAEVATHFSCYNTTIGSALGVGLPVTSWKVPCDYTSAASAPIGDLSQYERNIDYVLNTWGERKIEADQAYDTYHDYEAYSNAVEVFFEQL
jgi:hypothetical protein